MAYVQDTPVPQELQDFLEQSPIALALAAPGGDHPLLLVNHRFLELTGYAAHELIGRNCRMLQRGEDDSDARMKVRDFLRTEDDASVRTPIVNFRKDGTPFVNLLYLTRLRAFSGETRYFFASQVDVSRTRPDRLQAYDRALGQTLVSMNPIAAENGIVVEGALTIIANAAATIAQAKLTLAGL